MCHTASTLILTCKPLQEDPTCICSYRGAHYPVALQDKVTQSLSMHADKASAGAAMSYLVYLHHAVSQRAGLCGGVTCRPWHRLLCCNLLCTLCHPATQEHAHMTAYNASGADSMPTSRCDLSAATLCARSASLHRWQHTACASTCCGVSLSNCWCDVRLPNITRSSVSRHAPSP